MVVDVFRGVPGLIVIEDAVMSTRARAVGTSFSGVSDTSNRCAPTVFTDGVTPPNRDLGSMGSEEVEAIEVYWGLDIPEEYRRPGESPCAVILLWTAR
jgi:hypothetical protein